MRISDWSSDVCSSDLAGLAVGQEVGHHRAGAGTEAEPDVPVAEGEDRIPMARRAADDRHGVRHRGAAAHPAAFLAPVEAGDPAACLAVAALRAAPVPRRPAAPPFTHAGEPTAVVPWSALTASRAHAMTGKR